MKRVMMFLAVVTSFAFTPVSQAATWTGGGDGTSWNDAQNWDGAVPAANEDVTISPASAVDITMPSNTSVGKLTAKGASVRLTGGGWFTVTGIDATAYLDINANLNMNGSVGSYSLIFGGGADIRGQFNCAPYKSISVINNETLNFHGTFTMGDWTWMKVGNGNAGTTTGATTHFYGPLNVAYSIAVGGNTYRSGWLYIHSTGNRIGYLQQSFSRINTMAAGALPENLVIQWIDGEYTEEADNHRCWDFNGFDQTVNRVSAPTELSGKDHSRRLISTGGPMTLTLKGTADATARADVCGDISIVWNPTDAYTQEFVAYPSTMTGSIAVSNGTFKVSGGATFADVSKITIEPGAVFDLNSTAAGALANVPEVDVGGTLQIASTASNPFSAGTTLLNVRDGGAVLVASGTVNVNTARKGTSGIASGTYKAIGSSATGTECDWVKGEGTVRVLNDVVSRETRVWTGAGDGHSWNDPANWGGTVPRSFDTAQFSTDVVITDGFEVSNERRIVIGDGKTLTVSGPISGGANILRMGDGGTMVLTGDNTFSGDLVISNTTVVARGANALSSSSDGTIYVVKDGHTAGANLLLDGVTVRKTLSNFNKNDAGNYWGDSIACAAGSTNTLEGTFVNVNGGCLRMTVRSNARLNIDGGTTFYGFQFINRQAGAEVAVHDTPIQWTVYEDNGSAADSFFTFAVAGSSLGFYPGGDARGISSPIRTTVDNALDANSWCYFGGANARFDLCGTSQTMYKIEAMSGKSAGTICSAEPASLAFTSGSVFTNNAVFSGQVALKYSGSGTMNLSGASTATGALTVENASGTVVLLPGGSWAGTRFNVTGTLRITTKTAIVKSAEISITGNGTVDIPAGVRVKCRRLFIDGQNKTGVFRDTAHVTGGGRLTAGDIGSLILIK